jgi:hypothetical protein
MNRMTADDGRYTKDYWRDRAEEAQSRAESMHDA